MNIIYKAKKLAIPQRILEPMLKAAAQLMNIQSDIVVFISQRRSIYGTASFASKTEYVDRKGYSPSQTALSLNRIGKDMMPTNGGFVHLYIPFYNCLSTKTLSMAERIYQTILHEFGHIRDYQAEKTGKKLLWSTDHCNCRRSKWDNRPEEKRATRYVDEAETNTRPSIIQEAILDLAIWMDETIQRNFKSKEVPISKLIPTENLKFI